jgi:hypothetical protein
MKDIHLYLSWGAAGKRWRLDWRLDLATANRFNALAKLAGAKLEELRGLPDVPPLPKTEKDEDRWISALRFIGGAGRGSSIGMLYDDEGEFAGYVFSATIRQVAEVSAYLCLELEAMTTPRGSKNLRDALSGIRYAGVNDHWMKSQQFRKQENPDFPNAAREAISALEAVAKLVVGNESATLGNCLKDPKIKSRTNSAILKCLGALWGYTSGAAGVRHGSPTPASITIAETDLVLGICESGIRFLTALDSNP